jgi:hypothetical protein
MTETSSSDSATSTSTSTSGGSASRTAAEPTAELFAVGIVGSRALGSCECSSRAKHWPPTESEKAHSETCPKAIEWLRMIKIVGKLLTDHPNLMIVSGGAQGADTLAIDAGKLLGMDEKHLKVYPVQPGASPFWERARRRNGQIVERSSMIIAIFANGPRSSGTRDTVEKALEKGIPVHIWHEGSWHKA